MFHVGGGKPYTVSQFAKAVAEIFAKKDYQPKPCGKYRFGDTRHICSDISKLQKLGWKPRRSIQDSVSAYREWLDQADSAADNLGRLKVQETFEPKLLGSAGTVHHNRNWISNSDTALIVYADNLSNVDLRSFLSFHHSHGGEMTMLLFRAPYPERCGIAQLDK